MKKIAIIPAYQPEETMPELLMQLGQEGFINIVVDDGSGLAFVQRFEAAAEYATVLTHSENQGKGAALKTAMAYISKTFSPPYVVVTVDADGQHKPADALRICEEAAQHPDALILGSRKLNPSVPLRSKLGNTITRLVFRLTSGTYVYDTQTGLRAFSWQLLPTLAQIPGNRYEYEMQMLLSLAEQKIPMQEVPIETVYLQGNRSSHFDTVRDSYRIYKEILKFSASSLLSFGVDYLLFCLLLPMFGSVIPANIFARICSSTLNYTLNRKLVFRSNCSVPTSALRYFALAAGILLCNTLLVKLFCGIGVPALLAKLFTEMLLFLVSWLVQHQFIFKRGASES